MPSYRLRLLGVVGAAASASGAAPAERAADLLSSMTLDEKITLLHGTEGAYVGNTDAIPRLGIPALKMNDGPQGFRDCSGNPGSSTQFPAAINIAATFDVDAARQWVRCR